MMKLFQWVNVEMLSAWASEKCSYTLDFMCVPLTKRWGICIVRQRLKEPK